MMLFKIKPEGFLSFQNQHSRQMGLPSKIRRESTQDRLRIQKSCRLLGVPGKRIAARKKQGKDSLPASPSAWRKISRQAGKGGKLPRKREDRQPG